MADDSNANKILLVNFLPNDTSEEDVKTIFDRIGFVVKCKLICDALSGDSLGYAFVEYADEISAALAVGQLDGIKIQDKTLKVSYARQNPESKNSTIYVRGLPQWVSEDKLHALFSPFGNILSQNILTNSDGTTRGVGFVKFSLDTEATDAIEQMNEKVLPGGAGKITVKFALPAGSRQDSRAAGSKQDSQTAGSKQDSQTAGSIATNSPASDKLGAINTISPVTVHPDSSVADALAEHAKGLLPQAGVYVYGLKETHTELTLYELFSPFGAILNVKLIRDLKKEGKPCKGYGFVNYSKSEYASVAIAKMNGIEFEKKTLQVNLKNSNK